jgi:hypothetical protein
VIAIHAPSSSAAVVACSVNADDCIQAIAKAKIVRGNAARLGRSVHLCLCKTPGQDGLAALLLLVRGGAAEPTGDALAPTADAGVLRRPGCRA